MGRRLTLQDIALLTGTSKSTVSRVLTGKGYVAPEVRKSVLQVMEEQGYQPQKSHKNEAVQDMVMVIASQLDSEVQVILSNAVRTCLASSGVRTAIVSVEFGNAELYEYLSYAEEKKFAGVIVLGALDTDEFRESICRLTCPVVLLNQTVAGRDTSMVQMQDYEGGYEAARYLLELGHRKIVFLNGFVNAAAVADRERGFCDACADAGLSADEIHVVYRDFSEESGRAFAHEMALESFPYTAVLAANDLLGLGVLQGLKETGCAVPEWVNVLCFDDTLATRVCSPRFTVMRYDFELIGQALARFLLEEREKPLMSPERVSFLPELIVRESTAPPGRSE